MNTKRHQQLIDSHHSKSFSLTPTSAQAVTLATARWIRLCALAMSIPMLSMVSASVSAQPPDVVTSDGNQNTAMGTNALVSIGPGGSANTAAGEGALVSTTSGAQNTAVGWNVMFGNTTGYGNSALGVAALARNTTGGFNAAVGLAALFSNTTASSNTAVGSYALQSNTTGSSNTATGSQALGANTTGNNNAASGSQALYWNTEGSENVANGYQAMYENTTSIGNTAVGVQALYTQSYSNNDAPWESDNTALGYQSLLKLQSTLTSTGIRNTAVGAGALGLSVTGSNNVGLGFQAGLLSYGSNNVDIGNVGNAADNGTIRIGTSGTHTAAYVQGIYSTKVTGSAVYVTPSGQLGTLASAERFKTDIQPMGASTDPLMDLRPVTFQLKNDESGAVQYGLIAEEVAKVYPELVIRNDDGEIQGVRYEELSPMLLNKVQQQAQKIAEQQAWIAAQEARNAEQLNRLQDVEQQLAAVTELKGKVAVLSTALERVGAIPASVKVSQGL